MCRIIRHVVIPTLIATAFFATAALPVELLGCRNRGLIAALIALLGAILGVISAALAVSGKIRGNTDSSWWIISAVILTLPGVYIVLAAA
ncbi:MAG: hypothetical protein GF331_20220 [Chitinivibrionales bacterium]|nr:hypothetical protein [Chitinivibrionales bacterium]